MPLGIPLVELKVAALQFGEKLDLELILAGSAVRRHDKASFQCWLSADFPCVPLCSYVPLCSLW